MPPRYRVTLTQEERKELEVIARSGRSQSKKFINARALLLCDAGESGPSWNVADVATALGITSRTIEHLKKKFVEDGLETSLTRKQREKPPREVTFDGAFEARLITLACSDAPEGRHRWTVRLLADKAVELKFAESVSPMTVQRVLKKMNLSLTSRNTGKSLPRGAQSL
jgi:transposase